MGIYFRKTSKNWNNRPNEDETANDNFWVQLIDMRENSKGRIIILANFNTHDENNVSNNGNRIWIVLKIIIMLNKMTS